MTSNSNFSSSKLTVKIVVIVMAALLIVFLGLFGFCQIVLGGDKIYDGISVAGEDLGGLTLAEAEYLLLEKFEINSENMLTLSCKEASYSFPVSEIEPYLDSTATASSAFSYGRYGSLIERIKTVLDLKDNPIEIPIKASFNEDTLYVHTDKLTEDVGTPMEELSSSLSENTLTITPGKPGLEINRENAKNLIADALAKDKFSLELPLEEVFPATPNVTEIFNRFYTDAKDATFELKDGEINYIDEQIGVHFEKSAVEEALNSANSGVITLPVSVTEPEVTVNTLKAKMFRDQLATYSSRYNEAVRGRSHNVKLASSYINGTIMLPGDVFSYNDVVGPRTIARGFKEANVYVGSEVETGIGGGICQVSSTLFNTVVMSGLDIVTRTSHSLPVSYVPAGRDATVSYGSIDFKFSNPYDMPVKIVSSASGGINTVTIYGTNENPSRKICFETELIRTIPYTVKQTEDATLPEGTVKVETKGANGSAYNTYKVITENGTVVSRALLTKSTYNATQQKELIGTMPVEAQPLEPDTVPTDSEVHETQAPSADEPNSDTPDEPTALPSTDEETDDVKTEENTPSIKPVSPSAGEIE